MKEAKPPLQNMVSWWVERENFWSWIYTIWFLQWTAVFDIRGLWTKPKRKTSYKRVF